MEEELSNLPLKQVIKASCERFYPEEGSTFISKEKGHREESDPTCLVTFPSLPHLAHPCHITSFHNFSLFIKPSIKILKFNCFFGSALPYGGFHETYMKSVCMLSSCKPTFVSLTSRSRSETRRGSRENFPPTQKIYVHIFQSWVFYMAFSLNSFKTRKVLKVVVKRAMKKV